MRFKVGDEVIVIKNPSNNRFVSSQLGKIHNVKDIKNDKIHGVKVLVGTLETRFFMENEIELVTGLTKVLYE